MIGFFKFISIILVSNFFYKASVGAPKGLKVELSSHTDNRGRSIYNEKLAKSRASSAKAYLVNKGVPIDRIVIQSYGERKVIEDCGNGCSEPQHQNNRRTEIRLFY